MTEFRRVDLRAVDLLKRAKAEIGSDYWKWFGISAIAILLAAMAPFGILAGPMMCGAYLCWQTHGRGEEVKLDIVWRGFQLFVPSLIATLIAVGIVIVLMIPVIIFYIVGLIAAIEGENTALLVAAIAIFVIGMFIVQLAIGALTMFMYPLVADRRLSGVDAVKVSIAAVKANLGGVLRLIALNTLLGILGVAACYVGVLFVFPFTMGATWLAYREIFDDEGHPIP